MAPNPQTLSAQPGTGKMRSSFQSYAVAGLGIAFAIVQLGVAAWASEAPGKSDPTASGPNTAVSLDECIHRSLEHNQQIQLAAAQRDQSMAKLIPRQPSFRPTVEASASQSIETPTASLPLTPESQFVLPWEEHELRIRAEQTLYRPGGGANRSQIEADTSQAESQFRSAVDDLVQSVMKAYFAALQAQTGEKVALDAVDDVSQNVANVRTLIQAGQAVQLDLLQAQLALRDVQHDAFVATRGRQEAEANLNRLLGRPENTLVSLDPNTQPPEPPASLEDAVRTAFRARADLRESRAEIQSAQAGISLARQENGPTISAQAGFVLQTRTALQNDNEWMLRALISIPVLQTAEQQSDVAQAVAGLKAARAGLALQEDGLAAIVRKAWDDLQIARDAVDRDSTAVAAQQETLRAAQLKRRVGDETETGIAQARLKLEKAMSQSATDRFDVALRIIELRHECGILSDQLLPGAETPIAIARHAVDSARASPGVNVASAAVRKPPGPPPSGGMRP